jgi:hypothetical protein
MRQVDVEADGFRSDIERAPVGCFHQAGTAAGHDHQLRLRAIFPGVAADEPSELAGNFVVMVLRENSLGDGELAGHIAVARIGCERLAQRRHLMGCGGGLRNSRAAIYDDGIANAVVPEQQFRLEVLGLQAKPPRLVALEERLVLFRQTIAGAGQDGTHPVGRIRVLVGGFWPVPRQRLLAHVRMCGLGYPRFSRRSRSLVVHFL